MTKIGQGANNGIIMASRHTLTDRPGFFSRMISGAWWAIKWLLLNMADLILFAVIHTVIAAAAVLAVALAIVYGTALTGLALYIGAPEILSIIFGSIMGVLFWPMVVLSQKAVRAIIDEPEED